MMRRPVLLLGLEELEDHALNTERPKNAARREVDAPLQARSCRRAGDRRPHPFGNRSEVIPPSGA
jgi:hypothetical protein